MDVIKRVCENIQICCTYIYLIQKIYTCIEICNLQWQSRIYTMKLKVSQSKTLNQFSTHAIGGKNTEIKDCIINLISMIISYMYNENALVDT